MTNFFDILLMYSREIIPVLMLGFFLSGIIHEIIPDSFIEKHLGEKGIKGILFATLIGAVIPVCCWGVLPVAVSFRRKGASLGSVLAMLIATPATSVTAFFVTAKFLGLGFALYLFCAVIVMGVVIGLIGNKLNIAPKKNKEEKETCKHCKQGVCKSCETERAAIFYRIKSVFKYAFIEMPKLIGGWLILGIILAALIKSFQPVEYFIANYFTGFLAYIFCTAFAIIVYTCATASVPFVHALISSGLDIGPAFVLLLVGPITSYGTILVLTKEFGLKLVVFYLVLVSVMAVLFGYLYSLFL
ncbi:permease [bacterium]|nr:permease [bacterium]